MLNWKWKFLNSRQRKCVKVMKWKYISVQTQKLLLVWMSPHWHRVSFQDRVHLAEVEELVFLQVSRLCPHGVQHRSCMTLTSDEKLEVRQQFLSLLHVLINIDRPYVNESHNKSVHLCSLISKLVALCGCVTLERMKRSLLGLRGSSGRYFIVWKNSTDMISAALQHDVGWLQRKDGN